jgi:hypothetical protein
MERILTIKLRVTSADDLRDMLPVCGVFEMNDCIVSIDCPLDSEAEEVRKMVNILESVIHVVDVKVVGAIEHDGLEYLVHITEVPVDVAEGRKPRRSRF